MDVTRKKNLLITGSPGVGKTTLIRTVADRLEDLHPQGFYTQEIRKDGTRAGFELIGLDGRRGILAHMNIKGPWRVGKYGVDVEGFESFLSDLSLSDSSLVIIDEIGKMECFSAKFRLLIEDLLEASPPFLATIAFHGSASIEAIKQRGDVELYTLTLENRNRMVDLVAEKIRKG